MALTRHFSEETRRSDVRASLRLNSRVNLHVEWEEGGQRLQAAGFTLDISPKGCRAIVEKGFPSGQRLRIVNASNGKSVGASVMWRGHEGRKGWEMGLQLESSGEDFWGVEF